MSKPGAGPASGISLGDARDGPSGIRHIGGAKLNRALVWNVRTWPAMPREKVQAAPTARPKVPMRRRGADCLVIALKRGNTRGAKGAGHRHWLGSTGNGRNPMINGRRQPSRGGTSRMKREVHVRNLGEARGEIPRAYSACVTSVAGPNGDAQLYER